MSPSFVTATRCRVACMAAACCCLLTGLTTIGTAQETRALTAGNHTISLRFGNRSRAYIVHIPPLVTSARDLPLMLAFHGGGGEAAGFEGYAELDAVADREGFLVVYPYGTGVLPRRLLTWNAGECCGYAMNQHIDDVGFAMAVVDDVARRTRVDQRRIYATGHSNGAMMAHRLAAERADRIAAIVAVSGAYDMQTFAPSRRVAVMEMHSVDDPRALYNGGQGPAFPGTQVRSSHRPVMDGLTQWARNNGCGTQPRAAESRTGQANTANAGQTATLLVWDGCAAGAPVAHWKLTGVGHGWPGHVQSRLIEGIIGPPTTIIIAAEEIWRFVAPISLGR